MIGAIIGDVVGSRFEFNNHRSKDFELITKESTYTDDSILTIAIMDYFLHKDETHENISTYLQKWVRKYPWGGYGGNFNRWIYSDDPKPYNSCGNGSAMRVSAVGYVANSLDEVLELSYEVTACTHNHIEGLKGAYVTAALIYLARTGKTKEELKAFANEYYDIDLDYEDLRKNYYFTELCQDSVPQAIYCFLISNSFEDCLRTTISIGGDCDTTAAISCAIAEAYYKEISEPLVESVKNKLTSDMIKVVNEFSENYK